MLQINKLSKKPLLQGNDNITLRGPYATHVHFLILSQFLCAGFGTWHDQCVTDWHMIYFWIGRKFLVTKNGVTKYVTILRGIYRFKSVKKNSFQKVHVRDQIQKHIALQYGMHIIHGHINFGHKTFILFFLTQKNNNKEIKHLFLFCNIEFKWTNTTRRTQKLDNMNFEIEC